jgi:transcriptional regulator with XRE-family HTH domain
MFDFIIGPCLRQMQGGLMQKTIFTKENGVLLALLKKARQRAGLTQADLAMRIEETQSSVSKIGRGERRLDILELRLICTALGVPLVDFVTELSRELEALEVGDTSTVQADDP